MEDRVALGVKMHVTVEVAIELRERIDLQQIATENDGKYLTGGPDNLPTGRKRRWEEYTFDAIGNSTRFVSSVVQVLKGITTPPDDKLYEIRIKGEIGGLAGELPPTRSAT